MIYNTYVITRTDIQNIRHGVSDSHNKRVELVLDVAEHFRKQLDNIPDSHLNKIIVQTNIFV